MASKRISAALLALVTGVTTCGTAGAAWAAPAPLPRTCGGVAITLYGTAASETLRGTARRDVIWAGAGNDVVLGLGGDDVVCGGSGADTLRGGDGNDLLQGGDGADRLLGDAGNDRLDGGTGNDRLDGGAGRDRLVGGAGRDALLSRPGDTVTDGGRGDTVSRAPAVPVPAPARPVSPPPPAPPVTPPTTPPVTQPSSAPQPEPSAPTPVIDRYELWGPEALPVGRMAWLDVYRVVADDDWAALVEGTTVAWSVDDATLLKVNATTGQIVALAEGPVTVTATITAPGTAPVTVTRSWTVAPVALDGIVVDRTAGTSELQAGESADFRALRVYSDDSTGPLMEEDVVTWSSENLGVATVDPQTGTVTGVSQGHTYVVAQLADGSPHPFTARRWVTVEGNEAATEGLDLHQGADLYQLHLDSPLMTLPVQTRLANGTTGYLPTEEEGQVWESSDPTVLQALGSQGAPALLPLKAGTVTLRVTARGHSDSIQVRVSDAAPVSLELENGPFEFGRHWDDRLLVLPYATYADGTRAEVSGEHVTFASSDESVFTVDGQHVVRVGELGTSASATLTATYGSVSTTAPVTFAQPLEDPWKF